MRKLHIYPDEMEAAIELERRERAYRGERPPPAAKDYTVILVDDGAATGATMRAAVRAARKLEAKKIIVALPVASTEAHQMLRKEADAGYASARRLRSTQSASST